MFSLSDSHIVWQRLTHSRFHLYSSNSLYIYPDQTIEEQLPELIKRYSNDPDSMLRFNQAKIYVDGILELTTAALYEPYLDSVGLDDDQKYGFEYFGSNTTLNTVVQTLADLGFQLFFHVIGDRATGLALDSIEALTSGAAKSAGPHRLTHLFLVDERDRQRFVELGVVADFQLAPSSLSTEYIDFLTSDIIGGTRANQLLPAKEIYDTGAVLTLSSDWDADVLSPLKKIQTVLTRVDGRSFGSVEEVIPMLTLNAAKLLRQDNMTGSLEVGKFADFVVLDKNIFEINVTEISSARVVLTLLQGEAVFNLTRDGEETLAPTSAAVPTASAAAPPTSAAAPMGSLFAWWMWALSFSLSCWTLLSN